MAGLCWGAVVLVFFLSAGNSLAAVDQTWLTGIIEGIKNEYALGDSFSLAVNIPENQDKNNLQQVLQDDPADKVKQAVSDSQLYQGTRVVAAAQPGALSRVLENIQPFITNSQGNVLIIYSEESPCMPPCTDDNSIADKINSVTQNWSSYAFVFSKVADVPDTDTSQVSASFKQLSISKLGLDNIFRCYKPGDDLFQCTGCSSGEDVTPTCVANNALTPNPNPTPAPNPNPTPAPNPNPTPAPNPNPTPAPNLNPTPAPNLNPNPRRRKKGGRPSRQRKRGRKRGGKVRKWRKPKRGRKGGRRRKPKRGGRGGRRGKSQRKRKGRKRSKGRRRSKQARGKRRGRRKGFWGLE